jgi:hypothetical protein
MGDTNFNVPQRLQSARDDTKVSYTKLGNCGLRVSVPILGAMYL